MSIHRALNNAELLGLILALADTPTCARLVSTSSNFFNQGIVHVWKSLPTVKPLLLLIPGAQELELEENEYTIHLPPPPADFSRFDVYAPLVRSLATFNPGGRPGFDIDSSWQTLLIRARESALLPNLKEFTLDHRFKKDEEPILWVSAFISPSLATFGAVSVRCGALSVSYSTMTIVLSRVAYGCPNLESLTLHVGSVNSTQDDTSLFRTILEEPSSQTWHKFQNLSSFTTDVNALDANSLLSLSELPRLKLLDIQGMAERHLKIFAERLPRSTSSVSLLETSFPCLRHLTMRGLHYDDLVTVWNLKPLVKGLTHLQFYPQPSRDQAAVIAQLSSEFLPVLSTRSPQLTHLHIEFTPPLPRNGPILLDIEQLKCLATLPLRHVRINHACLYNPRANDSESPSLAERITALWPNVVVLKMSFQRISIGSLHHFAALSRLRYLELDIRWDEGWPAQGAVTHPPKDSPLNTLKLGVKVTQDFSASTVEEVAKYLLSFWPNLSHVGYTIETPVEPKVTGLDMLNFCIRTFQGLAETKQRIAQQYGEEAAKDLISSKLDKF